MPCLCTTDAKNCALPIAKYCALLVAAYIEALVKRFCWKIMWKKMRNFIPLKYCLKVPLRSDI